MPWKGKPFGWGVPTPFVNYLPETHEASVNVAHQIAEHLSQGPLDGEIRMNLSCLEPPSTRLVFELMLHSYNSDATVSVSVDKIPEPDPRQSEVEFSLWEYQDQTATPALPPPSPTHTLSCIDLALEDYDAESNWQQAKQLSSDMTLDQRSDVMAVMVYPPAVQAESSAWSWLQRIQLSAAQLVATCEHEHGILPEDSQLISLIQGPIDWTSNAAMTALSQWVRYESLPGDPVFQHFVKLLERLPREGYWSPYAVALENSLLLPDLPVDSRQQIEKALELHYQDLSE